MSGDRSKAIQKYLHTHCEVQARSLSIPPEYIWDLAIVLPLFDESRMIAGFTESLLRITKSELRPVLIAVINGKLSDDFSIKQSNHHCFDYLCRMGECVALSDDITLLKCQYFDILIVDCFREHRAFDDRQGVGLARKIGCDIAFTLWHRGQVRSPWIRTTDADVRLSEDYLDEHLAENTDLIVENFIHKPQDDTAKSWLALKVYDDWLRYYEAGLRYAESPYGWQTVGSTITVHASAYAAVRGFPKRLAGEDFYLINKILKIGSVSSSKKSPITILDRPSARVPFGTGTAVSRLESYQSIDTEFLFYHPESFRKLRSFLRYFPKWYDAPQQSGTDYARILDRRHDDPSTIELEDAVQQIRTQSPHPKHFIRSLHEYFDGLKTLQFVHYLRDHHQAGLCHRELFAGKDPGFLSGRTLEPAEFESIISRDCLNAHD